jgi:hypothetical protein
MVQNKLNNPTLTRDGVKNSIIPIQCIIVQYITNISLTAMGSALVECMITGCCLKKLYLLLNKFRVKITSICYKIREE